METNSGRGERVRATRTLIAKARAGVEQPPLGSCSNCGAAIVDGECPRGCSQAVRS